MEFQTDDIDQLFFGAAAGSSTASTTTGDELSWNSWSPDIDWEQVSGDVDDLHRLISSGSALWDNTNSFTTGAVTVDEGDSFSSDTTSSGGASSKEKNDTAAAAGGGGENENQLRLIHLLTAAAEAIFRGEKGHDLARVILVRLREMVSAGASMSPCASFGQLTANQAILDAVSGEQRVHIIDYDISDGVQWATLIQALISREDGAPPPPPHLRITAITDWRGSLVSSVQEVGRRLLSFAASVNLPFSFEICQLNRSGRFEPAAVKIVKGEAVVLNCILHQGNWTPSAASVGSFLAGAGSVGARLVTVVEEERTSGKEGEEDGFPARFREELRRYMAIWESLEAGFQAEGSVRVVVEKQILGPRIAGALRRQEEAPAGWWTEWMTAAEFGMAGLSFFNLCQARLLLGLFAEGFCVQQDAPNKIVLSWKSSRLLSASAWIPPPPASRRG
ncbi:Nodulation-signaling pathway 2 protein [Apostasia shenzhenica]|uniref:Nodulation-signaling pathway 2 protein n=1 Tax=Apostasia shenzhenica TaxID=1088818 RepID=A0A2I0B7I9_9ASPA|nr:Nodulation-signaling pathway 2 protein [Apostasia shenzhenica]